MKVGDYVRTDKGEIGKLKELELDYTTGKRLVTYYTYREVKENLVMFDNTKITQRFVDGSYIYLTDDELKNVEESIVKSSPNIIDLIEVGDYVNGCKIIELATNIEGKVLYLETDITEFDNVYACGNINIYEKDIRTIVTKEQFESMEYKIGE